MMGGVMVGAFPEWRAVGRAGRDHLMLDQTVAWCGMSLGESVAGGARERCKLCLAALRRYQDMAVAEPPERVTETVLLTVLRPAGGEDVAAVLARKLAAHTTWVWTVQSGDGFGTDSGRLVDSGSATDSSPATDSRLVAESSTDSGPVTDSADAVVQWRPSPETDSIVGAVAALLGPAARLRTARALVSVLSDVDLAALGLARVAR